MTTAYKSVSRVWSVGGQWVVSVAVLNGFGVVSGWPLGAV